MSKKYWVKHLELIPREDMNFLKFLVDELEYEVIDGKVRLENRVLGYLHEKKDKIQEKHC